MVVASDRVETTDPPGVKETLDGLRDAMGPRGETLSARLTRPVKPVLFRNIFAEVEPPASKLPGTVEVAETVKLDWTVTVKSV